jgi:ribosomal protein S6--L-glutamate ligase
MRKLTVGFILDGAGLTKEEKIFLKLAKKKNIELLMMNISKDLIEDIEEKIRRCDIFFNNSSSEFAIEIVKTIEELGKKIIDSSKTFYYDEDKWMFFLKCKTHKIPTVRTILLSESIPLAKKELKEFDFWPVILKRVEGTMGQYVDKADNLTQAEKIIRKFWKKGGQRLPIIAQEFIKSPSYRVTIIEDKIVQTALKESKGWEATGVYTDHFERFKIDKELKKIIDKIIKVFKIKICGVDLLKKEGKWLVLEINPQPGLDFFIKDMGRLIDKILNFLKKQIRKK